MNNDKDMIHHFFVIVKLQFEEPQRLGKLCEKGFQEHMLLEKFYFFQIIWNSNKVKPAILSKFQQNLIAVFSQKPEQWSIQNSFMTYLFPGSSHLFNIMFEFWEDNKSQAELRKLIHLKKIVLFNCSRVILNYVKLCFLSIAGMHFLLVTILFSGTPRLALPKEEVLNCKHFRFF